MRVFNSAYSTPASLEGFADHFICNVLPISTTKWQGSYVELFWFMPSPSFKADFRGWGLLTVLCERNSICCSLVEKLPCMKKVRTWEISKKDKRVFPVTLKIDWSQAPLLMNRSLLTDLFRNEHCAHSNCRPRQALGTDVIPPGDVYWDKALCYWDRAQCY